MFFIILSHLVIIYMDIFDILRTKRNDELRQKNTHLVMIKFPHNWVMKLMARAATLAFAIGSILFSRLILGKLNSDFHAQHFEMETNFSPLSFYDLASEGLLKMSDRILFIHSNVDEQATYESRYINHKIDSILRFDHEKQRSIPNDSYDVIFVREFQASEVEFMNRVLKVDGIVYLKRYNQISVAMKKTSKRELNSPAKRRLFQYSVDKKMAALKKLEDVLLEPPRAASGKSNRYLKRIKYLPDLMGDALESYPRRVFIDVGPPENTPAAAASAAGWFAKYYPTGNKNFEIYKIETGAEESTPQMGGTMSEWLRRNVRENEYVVMKAEAEVVEEMVSSKSIGLVDELFLECGIRGKQRIRKPRRAYWECLALYGVLRDEGVAVHQWWGPGN